MDPHVLLLIGAGLVAGYVAGLVGVGGGIIFTPVLLFYFRHLGVAPEVIAPLTVGTSLFCTLIAGTASAWFQYRRRSVDTGVALVTGLASVVAFYPMTRFVTTRPWYNEQALALVFSGVLLAVVAQMLLRKPPPVAPTSPAAVLSTGRKAGASGLTGVVAGTLSAAVGVGGGVIMVPAFHNQLHLPMAHATGTSSAAIVLISLVGLASYATAAGGVPLPASAVGYVDAFHALLLALPAVVTARYGVRTAHRIDQNRLRWSFALVAVLVVIRLVWSAL
jgi:hypothetical protein